MHGPAASTPQRLFHRARFLRSEPECPQRTRHIAWRRRSQAISKDDLVRAPLAPRARQQEASIAGSLD
jgi:hypothetical protein